MALTTTTLTNAVAANDTSAIIGSIAGLAVGMFLLIDGEMLQVQAPAAAATAPNLVIRGANGTKAAPHAAGANVTFGGGTDFAQAVAGAAQLVTKPPTRSREVISYSAAGAITGPTPGNDMVAIINGTNALAMTVANPTKDQDGDILYIVGNGKAAHTVTYTGGLGAGGATLDVGTFAAGGQLCVALIAANGIWCLMPSVPGGAGLANATVTWA